MPLTLQFGHEDRENEVIRETARSYGIELATEPRDRNYHPVLSGSWGTVTGAIAVGYQEVLNALALLWACPQS